MSTKKVILILLMAASAFQLRAQKLQYGGMQQLGLYFNGNGPSAALTMINGVRFHRFFTGIGADYKFPGRTYWSPTFSSSAFFLDTRYYINASKNFFSRLDLGINTIIPGQRNYYQWAPTAEKYRIGMMGALGIGFKARLGKEVFYSFDVGYSLRQLKYTVSPWGFGPSDERPADRISIISPAIVINMGIEIF